MEAMNQELTVLAEPLILAPHLSSLELVLASRAMSTLAEIRQDRGYPTYLKLLKRQWLAPLFHAQIPAEFNHDYCRTWEFTNVCAINYREDRHQSVGYSKAFGLKPSAFKTGEFNHLPQHLMPIMRRRRAESQQWFGHYVLLFPHPLTLVQNVLRDRFYRDFIQLLQVNASLPAVVPQLPSGNYQFLEVPTGKIHCNDVWDLLFLLLNASMVVGVESEWTHLSAAFNIPLLTITTKKDDAYRYRKGDLVVEYHHMSSDVAWFASDAFSTLSRLQSQLVHVP